MTPLARIDRAAIAGRLAPTDLVVDAGSLVALVGPNGGGKTSLLRAIAGVEEAQGAVHIDGEAIDRAAPNRRARLVGFLPASREMVWPLSVRDLMAMGSGDGHSVEQAIERLGLATLASVPVNQLSTGERSRVLLARLFANAPRLLLLDEPLANLDPYWVIRAIDLVKAQLETAGSAAIMSLHDLHLAPRFDRLVAIANGQIAFDGDPEEFLESSTLQSIFHVRLEEGNFRL